MIRDELKLNPEHRPHDGRKHFVTMAKKYGIDEYAIKYMVGHKISDITEKVYTQREFEWLKEEIEKILKKVLHIFIQVLTIQLLLLQIHKVM